jgi:signal transduction histidine kinase
MTVWLPVGFDICDAQELLNQITPAVAMGISDALSFSQLTAYHDRERVLQREFSRRLIESQEAERKRLAAELHDGLGQNLLVMKNELDRHIRQKNAKGDALEEIEALIQETIEGVREISSNLHPHHLEKLGLSAAIEVMAEKIARSSGLDVRCDCDDVDRLLPRETAIHLYRIVQEALSNVVRHASATSIRIAVKVCSRSIVVTISDDGRGLQMGVGTRDQLPAGARTRSGFGLTGMNERARIIGGTLSVDSPPGSGTIVSVSLPLS